MRRLALILVAAALVVSVQPGVQALAPAAGWPAPADSQRDRETRAQDREEQTERTTKTVRIGSAAIQYDPAVQSPQDIAAAVTEAGYEAAPAGSGA